MSILRPARQLVIHHKDISSAMDSMYLNFALLTVSETLLVAAVRGAARRTQRPRRKAPAIAGTV
jgi:hypothetical protein